jgi:hypothetical protein
MTTIATNAEQVTLGHARPSTPLLPVSFPGPARVSHWRFWARRTAGRVYLNRPNRNQRTHWLQEHADIHTRSHAANALLGVLLEHANADHEVWMSQKRLSQMVSASVRQVRRAITWLRDAGMLVVLPGRGVQGPSGWFTNRYRVLIRECECSGSYDYLGRERPGSDRLESLAQPPSYSQVRTSSPPNLSTPPLISELTFLTACEATRTGRHAPDPEGFCYACGHKT